ncbi:MAG TPA: hypothetical protein VJQ26_01025, partial [Ktedonobacteraceae bacterium]|nr:hypothetical protein [Ktedonobacteraceae bacterium]
MAVARISKSMIERLDIGQDYTCFPFAVRACLKGMGDPNIPLKYAQAQDKRLYVLVFLEKLI